MRWQAKAAVQAILSRLPVGHRLHRRLQDVSGTATFRAEREYRRKADLLGRMRDQGLPIEGRTFMEVGTGWHPVLPLLLVLLGADRVVTTDVNPWLTPRSLRETLTGLDEMADALEADFGVPADRSRAELRRVAGVAGEHPAEVDAPLRAAGVQYVLLANGALATDGRFDYVVSTNVLSHIPPPVLEDMAGSWRGLLKPGGWAVHHLSPGDHFASDPRITTANFLKFSPRAWRYIGGSGIAYHNRLRCVDFSRLLERHGFEIAYDERTVDEQALAALRSGELTPHETFAGYLPEELAAYMSDVFARYRPGASESTSRT
jgi:hypothetical protein